MDFTYSNVDVRASEIHILSRAIEELNLRWNRAQFLNANYNKQLNFFRMHTYASLRSLYDNYIPVKIYRRSLVIWL